MFYGFKYMYIDKLPSHTILELFTDLATLKLKIRRETG